MGRWLIYALTTLSSLLLLIAARAMEADAAWFAGPPLRSAWFAGAITVPLSVALLWSARHRFRSLFVASSTGVTITALAAYAGTAFAPDLHLSPGPVFSSFVRSTLLAWFVVLPYLQGLCDRPPRQDYPALFHRAWDNLLTLLTALAFTVLSWLILWLSASLFELVGLGFLQQLLEQDSFYFPATGLLLGFGLTLGRAHLGALRSVLRICLSFSQVLLPAVSGITVGFFAALVLSDLSPLWDTGHATFLLLTLVFLLIALVNGVYADGREAAPYARPVGLVVSAGLLVLPVLAGIAAYAMGLRVGQYGLTVARLYGMVAIAFALLYSVSYAIAALRGLRAEAAWMPGLGAVNRALGLLLALILLLSQSPGLSFRERALAYQLETLDLHHDSPGTTDWMYLRFQLGLPGYRAVQDAAVQARARGLDTLAAYLDGVLAATHPHRPDSVPFQVTQWLEEGRLRLVPENTPLPPDLAAQMGTMRDELPLLFMPQACQATDQPCLLIAVELDRQPPQEWVLVPPPSQGCDYPVFVRTAQAWEVRGQLRPGNHCMDPDTYAAVAAGDWTTRSPAFDDLLTGSGERTTRWHFQPR